MLHGTDRPKIEFCNLIWTSYFIKEESFLKTTAMIRDFKYMNNRSELALFGTDRAAVMRSDSFCFFSYIKDC